MTALISTDAKPHRRLMPKAAELASDPGVALEILRSWPNYAPTPLSPSAALAARCDIESLYIKDETGRMGLGSFKGLGGTYAVARSLMEAAGTALERPIASEDLTSSSLRPINRSVTFVCASAGNHGLAVAAGAARYGAHAVVYLNATVPEAFADQLRTLGAEVIRCGATYEQSVAAAAEAATIGKAVLLADTSWPGYWQLPRWVMTGYMVIMDEIRRQMPLAPTHVFVQAGVGGLAGAMAHSVRQVWGEKPCIVIVEPSAARCLLESRREGRPVAATGPQSTMARLDCKEPSLLALDILGRSADAYLDIEDADAGDAVAALSTFGLNTTPSGAAGVAGVCRAAQDSDLRQLFELSPQSRVLSFVTESGPGVSI